MLLMILVGYYIPKNIQVSLTKSIDRNVFLITDSLPKKGDYANVVFPAHPYLAARGVEGKTFTKKVSCVPGDYLETRGNHYYCNDDYLGSRFEKDGKGISMPVFTYSGSIPDGVLFVSGTNHRSGDSRYFGFVPIESTKKVIDLW